VLNEKHIDLANSVSNPGSAGHSGIKT